MTLGRMIAVIGPGGEASEEVCAIAYEVGFLLAERGFAVVNGGLDGVMAAASRGASEAGGLVVGMLPGDDAAVANPFVTLAVPTGLGQARNALVVAAADAVIAVGGSWGTLSEVALARRGGKPVVCIGGWRVLDRDGQPIPLDEAENAEQAVAFLDR